MRVRVSGMVWLPKSEAEPRLLEYLRRDLTIVPRQVGNYGNAKSAPEPIRCYFENSAEFGVPRVYWFSRAKGDYEYMWDVSRGSKIELETTLKHVGRHLEQQACIDAFLEHFARFDEWQDGVGMGGILQAQTAFGKTATALGLVKQLGMTTIVMVHKEFLMRQWVQRIQKFLPNARIGIVQEKQCDFEGKDIVVAMMPSISMIADDPHRYPRGLLDHFGLLITDEVHRVAAPTWSSVPQMFSAAFRLGLTATPRRKDGADDVFWWHIGEIIYRAKKVMPKPGVRMVYVREPEIPAVAKRTGISSAIVTNVIAGLRAHNHRTVVEIVKALEAPTARKVMVISERLEHLEELEKSVKRMSRERGMDVSTSFYVGEWFTGDDAIVLKRSKWKMDGDGREMAIARLYRGLQRKCSGERRSEKRFVTISGHVANMIYGGDNHGADDGVEIALEDLTDGELFDLARAYGVAQKPARKKKKLTEEQLTEAETARVMFATVQMIAEGVDVPAVDTLVLATPIGDVEQTIGRVRRECIPVSNNGDKTTDDCVHYCPWRHETCKGKPTPVVVDIVDDGIPMAIKRSRYRREFYENSGFVVAG